MTHDNVRNNRLVTVPMARTALPVTYLRSHPCTPYPEPFPFPFSSAKRLRQAHMPHKKPANILEVTESEMVHWTQGTLYCGSNDMFRRANNRDRWCKGLVPHHVRREGHRSQGLGWVGVGISYQTHADSASNAGSRSNPLSCGI